MKVFQNIFVGFFVSFVGSIPLGYLNLIGFQIYINSNLKSLIWYLLGVVLVEGIVIYVTLLFVKKLSENKKLLKTIDAFSIFFMLALAIAFYLQLHGDYYKVSTKLVFSYSFFLTGVILSSLNFVQIPFWVGWNLYLVNNNYIILDKDQKISYVFGTLLGTFCGMFGFIFVLKYLAHHDFFSLNKLISIGIPLFFLFMSIYQGYKFIRVYVYKK